MFKKYDTNGIEVEDVVVTSSALPAGASTEATLSALSAKFPSAATPADDTAAPSISKISSFLMAWDSANGDWDRVRSSAIDSDGAPAHAKGCVDVMSHTFFFNGATYDRARGDTTYGLDVDVTRVGGTVTTKETRCATGTNTSVSDNAASTTILASNANRLGATVTNDSSAALYLLLGSTSASTTNYSVRLTQYGYYEVPFGYTGQLTGIWASDPNDGAARVTELTA